MTIDYMTIDYTYDSYYDYIYYMTIYMIPYVSFQGRTPGWTHLQKGVGRTESQISTETLV